MNFKKAINAIRRTLMHTLTKGIGASHVDANIDMISKAEIRNVLICRPNHRLGNLLLITPIVQEVVQTFPHCQIDLLVKGNHATSIFKNYENISHIIQLPGKPLKNLAEYIQGWASILRPRYDLVINVIQNSSSGRLSARLAHAKHKFFGDDSRDPLSRADHEKHIAKYPVVNFRDYLSKRGIEVTKNAVPNVLIKLNRFEINRGKKVLHDLVKNERPTISLFTYATGDKCYSEAWWKALYDRLTAEYPKYNVIEILPIENVSKLSFKAPTFYSKDVREIGSVIANTQLFIGADSGMMHLASAVQTPTVGLFSVTDAAIYQPYANHSIGINTNGCTMDELVNVVSKILFIDPAVPHQSTG